MLLHYEGKSKASLLNSPTREHIGSGVLKANVFLLRETDPFSLLCKDKRKKKIHVSLFVFNCFNYNNTHKGAQNTNV